MALADFQPERSEISYKGKPLISVRGLNFEDTTVLVRNHLPALQTIYNTYGGRKLLPNEREVENILFDLLTSSPDTAARIISLAAEEPGGTEGAKRLPVPLALKILFEVVRLTFEDVGGPLAFAVLVRGIMGQMEPASENLIQ